MQKAMGPEGLVDGAASDSLLRQFVGYRLKLAWLPVHDDLTATLDPLGLRISTFSALSVVVENPGISQTQLSVVLNLKRSGVVVIADELEQAGLLERLPVPGDRRAYALHATAAGTQQWHKAVAAIKAHEARLFADLTVEEQRQLKDLLHRATRSALRRRTGE